MQSLRAYLAAPFRPPVGAAPARVAELDGLRGWAALGVVCYHVFWETLFVRAPEMRNIVTGVFFDGGLAVSIFFVLSGEALSAPYFAGRGDAAVRALAIKRYTRLAIPILASCALLWALGAAGWIFSGEAAAFAGRVHWLTDWLRFPLTLGGLVRYAALDAFTLVRPAQEWNPFLGTMGVELDCSLLVFALLLFARDVKGFRVALLIAAVAMALAPWRPLQNVSCFLVGMLFADLRARGGFAALGTPERQSLFAAALGALLLSAGARAYAGYHDHKNLYAIGIVFLVFVMPAVSGFFRAPLSQFLGRVLFPLYLVQFPVIASPLCGAMVFAESRGLFGRPMAYALGLGAVALTVALAGCFLPVERFTAAVGAALVRFARRPAYSAASGSIASG